MAAARYLAISIFILAVTFDVRSQFFDLFQPFHPYIQTLVSSPKPMVIQKQRPPTIAYLAVTKKPPTTDNYGNGGANSKETRDNARHTQKKQTNKQNAYTERQANRTLQYPSLISVDNGNNNRKTSASTPRPLTNNNQHKQQSSRRENVRKPASSPVHKSSATNRPLTNKNSDQENKFWNPNPIYNTEYSDTRKDKRRPAYESDGDNNIQNNFNVHTNHQFTTKQPNFSSNYRPNDYQTGWTTQNPFVNVPGMVKPVGNHNRPPITNKPPETTTHRPNVNRRPDDGSIVFPREKEDGPDLISGLDEENMSGAERKRYIEVAERMCDKYKSLHVKQLAAIPLLPSPDPVAVNVTRCVPINVPLVVGGKVVSIQEFPHMALLGWSKLQGGYSWKCGGSLISELYVLTAAHCSYQDRDNTVTIGPPRVVQLGSSFLDDPGAIVVKVASATRHPKYKIPSSYYDLAVLRLTNRVTFSERIKPACLGVAPPPGNPVIATGWGRTEFGGEQSQELRSVSITVWDIRECWNVLETSRKLPEGPSAASQVCAGELEGGKDTCQGDSGGPIQTQDGCMWRIVGVTSLGRSCGAAGTPGLYAIPHRAFISAVAFGNR